MSDMIRMSGMVSGMDTEATVKELMKFEKNKVDKAEQEKQVLEWQKEQYQEMATMFDKFQKDFFDIGNPKNNLGMADAFNAFDAVSSSDAISVEASGKSHVGTLTITSISQLAQKDKYVSGAAVAGAGALRASANFDINNLAAGDSFKIKVNEKEIDITLKGNYQDNDDFISDINSQLAKSVPATQVAAGELNGALVFNSSAGSKLTIKSGDSNDALAKLNFTDGQSAGKYKEKTMNELGITDLALKINNKDVSIGQNDTVQQVMDKINNSEAGVTITYDDFSGKFSLEANKSGAGNKIDFADNNEVLKKAFNIDKSASTVHTEGQDAVFKYKTKSGEEMMTTRSNNKFEFEGNRVTLNRKTEANEVVNIDVKSNTKDAKDKIVKFVDSYNKILDHLKKKTTEKRYRDFAPLTAEQKKDLEEEDEKKWQEKAKSGLLTNDFHLKSIASKMRQALYESVEGAGITLKDIGITTSKDWKEGGKLSIDENKLDKALAEKPDEVVKLFTAKSDKKYGDSANGLERYRESGLADRLNDIINDNIKTTGDHKGYLIRKAGKSGKIDVSSDLYKKIKASDKKIAKLIDMMSRKEDNYYRQFAAMEAAMQRYQAQAAQMMGGM